MPSESDIDSCESVSQSPKVVVVDTSKQSAESPTPLTAFRGLLKGKCDQVLNQVYWDTLDLTACSMIVYPSCRAGFDADDCRNLIDCITHGGSVLLQLHEQMSVDMLSNVNYILEHFGISVCLSPTLP